MTTLLFGKGTLKFDEVVAAFLMNETRRGSNGFSNDDQVAMVTKEYSRGRGWSKEKEERSQRSRSSGRKFKCYYCDEEGHMKKDCPKRKKVLRDEKPSVVGVAEGSSLYDGGDVFLATDESPGKSNWILDSGCSFHMSAVREHFDTYQPCEKGTVNMANGTQSRIAGVGTVRIRMFDGVVRTVTGVRHVPGLKRNLISLGTLDARGYRYSSQGGALKVSKGAMVVLKGEMSGGLYRLVGKVQIDGAAREATTSDSSKRHAVGRKWVTFASGVEGGGDLGRLS